MTVVTTPEAAELLDVSQWKVRQMAKTLRIGYNVRGKSGWKFTAADLDLMRDSMRPVAVAAKRRRRRSA